MYVEFNDSPKIPLKKENKDNNFIYKIYNIIFLNTIKLLVI